MTTRNRDLPDAAALPSEAELAERIDPLFAEWNRDATPGATVAVVRDGDILWARGYGMANLEHEVPNGTETVFYIASASKQFVATAIAMLEADGALSLDDDVRDHVPELHPFEPPIRIHHLIHHTSGLRDKYSIAILGGMPESSYATDAGTLELLRRQRTLNFPPGSRHLYSNSGYWLLAQIVARVIDASLREFAEERIFAPLGMTSTQFRDDTRNVLRHRASGYARRPGDRWQLAEMTWNAMGPGGVVSTVGDLARWDANFADNRLQPADLPERLLRTRPLTDGTECRYAFGLSLQPHRGMPAVSHSGSVEGFRCEFLRLVDRGVTVVCLANSSAVDAPGLARAVADVVLGLPPVADGPRVQGDPASDELAGRYVSTDGTAVADVTVEDGGLELTGGTGRHRLEPLGQRRFRAAEGLALTFDADDGFRVLVNDRQVSRFRRVEAAPVADLPSYVGQYRSDELSCDVGVTIADGTLQVTAPSGHAAPLQPVEPDLFVATVDSVVGTVSVPVRFHRDEHDRVSSVGLSVDRALDNRFHRVTTTGPPAD